MPNGISSYNVYKGAGEAMGEFESSLGDVEGIWGDVDYSREMSALKTQQRESNIDSLMAVAELGSTLYGGWKAKKEFEGDLTSAQKMAAKKIYGADYTPEQLAKVKPFEVGAEGEAWGDLEPLQKMFQEKQYRFGAGDDSYTMGKADITAAAGLWKYGTSPDISGFKTPSMMDEASGTDNYNVIGSADAIQSDIIVDQGTGIATTPLAKSDSTVMPELGATKIDPVSGRSSLVTRMMEGQGITDEEAVSDFDIPYNPDWFDEPEGEY